MKKRNIHRILAGLLALMLMLSCLAGCQTEEEDTAAASAQDAINYLKAVYQDNGTETAADFNRFSTVRVAGIPFEVVWTASVGEDLVKIVPNDDGTVTVDISDEIAAETEYTLTATITDEKGNSVTYTWNYVLPAIKADPAADSTLTVQEAIALGTSKAHDTYTTNKYYVTGVVTDIYNTTYGNMKIKDAAGNILTIYGTYSADGKLRFDAMTTQPAVGSTVTIYGIIGQYNNTPQIKNGWITKIEGATTTPSTPSTPSASLSVVTDPQVGVAYKFGMVQEKVSTTDVYYLKGGMDGYYMASTKDASKAIDVYLEATNGGYYLYTMDGTSKLYINMVISTTHVNGAYETTAKTVYTYDAEKQTLVADMQPDGKDAAEPYWFGTRNDKTYTTIGPCAVSYAGFYCKFYK